MPRGRPKKATGDVIEYDVRVTPTDQQEIDFAPSIDDFEVFIAAKEYGKKSNNLHYHIYCKSIRSKTYLRSYFSQLGKANDENKGNAVFRIAYAHEGTIGYVVKDGDIVCRMGCSDQFISEMLSKSKEYKQEKEAERKRKQRTSESIYNEVYEECLSLYEDHKFDQCVRNVIRMYCAKIEGTTLRPPPRSTIESLVVKIMMVKNPEWVIDYYSKNLSEYRI